MSGRESNEELDNLIAILEHDLRNPLTAIMGFSDLLGMTELDPDQRELLSRVQGACERLLEVVETMAERTGASPRRTD